MPVVNSVPSVIFAVAFIVSLKKREGVVWHALSVRTVRVELNIKHIRDLGDQLSLSPHIRHMLNQDNFSLYHFMNPKCSSMLRVHPFLLP